jgi:hypothetical protein
VPATQLPEPLQLLGVMVEPLQVEPQAVPEATLRHPPLPSHVPSLPQGLLPVSSAQAKCGSRPLFTGLQVPSGFPVMVCLQALHVSQTLSQQIPSAQVSPSAQSAVEAQTPPCGESGASLPAGLSDRRSTEPVSGAVSGRSGPASGPPPAVSGPASGVSATVEPTST